MLDAYPLPRMADLLETVSKFCVFSTFDLRSAYHQIAIQDSDKPYTAFEANGSLYQFCRLPFGLTNSVACFQRLMNDFIKDNELVDTFAYLDNILVCGMDTALHDHNLERFLKEASRCGFTFNEEKCETKKATIDFGIHCWKWYREASCGAVAGTAGVSDPTQSGVAPSRNRDDILLFITDT